MSETKWNAEEWKVKNAELSQEVSCGGVVVVNHSSNQEKWAAWDAYVDNNEPFSTVGVLSADIFFAGYEAGKSAGIAQGTLDGYDAGKSYNCPHCGPDCELIEGEE